MRIIRVQNQSQAGQKALGLLTQALEKGAKVLGLATGSSPLPFYEALRKSPIDLRQVTSINLDEYKGLGKDEPQSYQWFMQEHLFQYKSLKNSFLPNGQAQDPQEEIFRYQEILKKHPIDFQILGIGSNGHIGFNEPHSPFDSQFRLVDLDSSTIEANSRFFKQIDQVPKQAYSMGIKDILSAKTIILFAFGYQKAKAVRDMIEGPVTEKLPASILQKHPNTYIIADDAALSMLYFEIDNSCQWNSHFF